MALIPGMVIRNFLANFMSGIQILTAKISCNLLRCIIHSQTHVGTWQEFEQKMARFDVKPCFST